jgi:cell division septal protein FtsQ
MMIMVPRYRQSKRMEPNSEEKRAANIRLALLLAAVAVGVLVAFIWSTAGGGGSQ